MISYKSRTVKNYYVVCSKSKCHNTLSPEYKTKIALLFRMQIDGWFHNSRYDFCPEHNPKRLKGNPKPYSEEEKIKLKPLIIENPELLRSSDQQERKEK